MKKVVLIPDSFKGTMSSSRICDIIQRKIKQHDPTCKVVSIPVADGGEGTVDCFLEALHGTRVSLTVNNPYLEPVRCSYGMIDDGKTAVIEMASCAGLSLIEDRLDPLQTTTYGVGELIADAVRRGCRKIVIGLGGSSTNDGGVGAASALGIRFLRENGEVFLPMGGTLNQICDIDSTGLLAGVEKCDIVCMYDIDNPMFGPTGASYIFGPQKGADSKMVELLDENIRHLAQIIKEKYNVDVAKQSGAGAGGAMGAGMAAFLHARLQSGIETVLDAVHFEQKIQQADFIITGEGKFDSQSLRGKVVIGVAKRAKPSGIPVIAVVGDIEGEIDEAYSMGVASIFSINRVAIPYTQAKLRSENDLALTVDTILRFYDMCRRTLPPYSNDRTDRV